MENAGAVPLREEGAIKMWARRLIVGSSFAVASLAMVPGIAGASQTCTSTGSMTEPSCVTVPAVAASTSHDPAVAQLPSTGATAKTTSLPFTGADVGELAVLGAGAVLAGGLLVRRRRSSIS